MYTILMVCLAVIAARQASPLQSEIQLPTLAGRPLIPTRWTAGCGINALYVCLDLNGVEASYADVVAKSGLTSPSDPIDLGRLWQMARECGAHAQAVRVVNGPAVLRQIMQDLSLRTAIVHLRALERGGKHAEEHFSAVVLAGDTLRIVGRDTYEREAATDWQERWSGAALLVSSKPILLAGPEGAPLPQIFITPSKFDCGTVYAGTSQPYQFTIENRGDGELEIVDVQSDCSCSTPKLGTRRVLPRHATTLTGFVETGPSIGRRTVRITVFATDPERPQVPVELTLNVVPLPIKLSESKATLVARSRAERPAAKLDLEYTDPNVAIRVARLETSAGWFRAELSADARQIALVADPVDGPVNRSGTLTLHTANPEAVLKVPVEVRVDDPIECRPAQLYLDRTSEPGPIVRRTLQLRPRRDVVLTEIKAAVRGVPAVVQRVARAEQDGNWEVELEFSFATTDTSMVVGVVEISSGLGDDENVIRVPVYVR